MTQNLEMNTEKLAETVLPEVALQNVMQYPLATTSHGGVVYAVPQGWENKELKADAMFKHIMEPIAFETALRSGSGKMFYAPNDAALTVDLICKIMERNGSTAAVFVEQTKVESAVRAD